MPNYYPRYLSTQPFDLFEGNESHFINQIMDSYDFIGVSERLDESIVALSMLMNIPLADVLYLSAKGSGGFDEGGHAGTCFYIVPSFVSPGMRRIMESGRFQKHIHWDHVIHQAANRSLDLTIDKKLGREKFEKRLAIFQKAQARAKELCLPQTTFPCATDGGKRPRKEDETDCLWKDSGCGYKCLDRIATELDLWGTSGPFKNTRPDAFRQA
eukprot:CAMPEP_0172453326 /NCGR_PEP_ID=MMETSP1065-20121228/10702_1 /TAXON_ID=265537 /ORGANISM="Amphiprora paludosa, Strain CCMP125" /LENGTH=212 /DNA_ID=CAMNT_0013205505 /DNA_START=246 /DNA_END=884 /DNA_ORIENTATION=-